MLDDEDRAKTARALMAVTETEAACLHLLETLERARVAMRAALEGGGK